MSDMLKDALAEATKNNRVCPQPPKWTELWNMLRERIPGASANKPEAPLILAGWSDTTDREKAARFRAHLTWADRNGCLDPVLDFMRSLQEGAWHHFGE